MYARARQAQRQWAALRVQERAARIAPLAGVLAARSEELAELIHAENGKPRSEAMGQEVLNCIRLVQHACRTAPRVLAPRTVKTLMAHRQSQVHRRPFGVVLIVSPWNIPLYIPLGQVVSALLAGNAVVLKPSELTPRCGAVIAELLELPEGLLQVVQGDGTVGAELIAARPDRVCFTGSVATGRKVMAACASFPIPVSLELGGVDAMIVREDADLELAASAATWGATFNGGQACCSVERLLVHRSIHDAFLARVADKMGRIDRRRELAPAIDQRQLRTWIEHVEDARARGLRLRCGGDEVGDRRIAPTLVEASPEALCWTDETFGPVVAALPFDDDDDAVRLHDATPFGLTASVFGRDLKAAASLASRLRAGGVAVNDVAATLYASPELPWGGVGASGFGRSHGAEGLLEGTWAQVIDLPRLGVEPKKPWWYPYDDEQERAFGLMGRALAGEGRVRHAARAGRALLSLVARTPRI